MYEKFPSIDLIRVASIPSIPILARKPIVGFVVLACQIEKRKRKHVWSSPKLAAFAVIPCFVMPALSSRDHLSFSSEDALRSRQDDRVRLDNRAPMNQPTNDHYFRGTFSNIRHHLTFLDKKMPCHELGWPSEIQSNWPTP
jgi:hypothetical protein